MRYDICLGVLAFSGVATLDRTLSSMAPLFDRVVRQIILFQEIDSPERQAWAESVVAKFPTLQPVYQTENLGQRLAFRRLADECANSTSTRRESCAQICTARSWRPTAAPSEVK